MQILVIADSMIILFLRYCSSVPLDKGWSSVFSFMVMENFVHYSCIDNLEYNMVYIIWAVFVEY